MNFLQLAVLPFSLPAAVVAMPIIFTADALLDATEVLISHRVTPHFYEGTLRFDFPTDLLDQAHANDLGVYPLGGELTRHVKVSAYSTQEAEQKILGDFHRKNPGLHG